jgi:hypothetical protein
MPYEIPKQIDPTRLFKWEYGRPAELWLSYRSLISGFIKKNKLSPLPPEAYPYFPLAGAAGTPNLAAESEATLKSLRVRWPIPFPGGMRVPHVHFDHDVYLMEPEQWNDFSNAIVKDISHRLADVSQLSFDSALQAGQFKASLSG